MRQTLLIAIAVVAFTWACGSSSGTSVAPTFVPSANQVAVKITLAVTNTQWNTGIVDDFSIVVSGGHADFTLAGYEGVQQIYVDRGVPFSVRATGPEGYTETKSGGCADQNPQSPLSCELREQEAPFTCDPLLWNPIYRKDRLKILSACEIGVVTVAYSNLERDGDADILGTADPASARLLGPGNSTEAKGNLVIEIPCQGPVTQADAMGTCAGFKGSRVDPPLAVGERIVAAAHWVEDRNHSMQRELHGARIRRLPR